MNVLDSQVGKVDSQVGKVLYLRRPPPRCFFHSAPPAFFQVELHPGGTSLTGSCGEYWTTSRRVCAASTAGARGYLPFWELFDLTQPMVILALANFLRVIYIIWLRELPIYTIAHYMCWFD